MELIDVPLRVPKRMADELNAVAEMCGLTASQVASAVFAMNVRRAWVAAIDGDDGRVATDAAPPLCEGA